MNRTGKADDMNGNRDPWNGRPSRRLFLTCGVIALGGMLACPGSGWGETGAPDRAQDMLTVAVPDLASLSDGLTNVAHSIAQSIIDDLGSTGRFKPVNVSATVAKEAAGVPSQRVPDFALWRAAGAQVLVTGRVVLTGEKLKAELFVWDVATGQTLAAQALVTRLDEWRQISDAMASVIYERCVGEKREFGPGGN